MNFEITTDFVLPTKTPLGRSVGRLDAWMNNKITTHALQQFYITALYKQDTKFLNTIVLPFN